VRHLIAQELLPLIKSAPGLKRIVDVAAGAHEAELDLDDLEAERCSRSVLRGRLATTKTLAWQGLAKEAPEVSIITDFPGLVVTPIFNRIDGVLWFLFKVYTTFFGWLFAVPLKESAERHAFLATSSSFPSREGNIKGVPLVKDAVTHKGIDGIAGSGVYSVDWDNEGPGDKVVRLLNGYALDGTQGKVWKWVQDVFNKVLRDSTL